MIVVGVPELVLEAFAFFSIVWKVVVKLLDTGRNIATVLDPIRRDTSVLLIGDIPLPDVMRGSTTGTFEGGVVLLRRFAVLWITVMRQAVLLSNDHGFVDRSIDAGVPAQHIGYPIDVPRTSTGTWTQAAELLYYLAILFGVIRLPKVTVYGVWNGKDGWHWQHEQLDIDCRSPKIEPQLKRDLTILDATY